jgi:hypothetical protein
MTIKQAMDLIGRLDIAVYHLIQAKYFLTDNPEPDGEIDTAIDFINSVIKELKREYNIVGYEPERNKMKWYRFMADYINGSLLPYKLDMEDPYDQDYANGKIDVIYNEVATLAVFTEAIDHNQAQIQATSLLKDFVWSSKGRYEIDLARQKELTRRKNP